MMVCACALVCALNAVKLKPGTSEDETFSLSFGMELSCTLIASRVLLSTLKVLNLFMRVDASFLTFVSLLTDSRRLSFCFGPS